MCGEHTYSAAIHGPYECHMSEVFGITGLDWILNKENASSAPAECKPILYEQAIIEADGCM
jgi:hypothetical protein